MKPDEFEALVKRAEELLRRRPARYRRLIAAFAALGFGYVGFVLVVTVALLVATLILLWRAIPALTSWTTILLSAVAFAVVRALWVRLEPPDGVRLHREVAPDLFALVDAVRHEVGAPRPHVVLVDESSDAAVAQVPRLGVFGWHRNFLVLGGPLLCAMQADELRSILAHEFGHLAHSHGWLGAWIYRVRMTWARLQHDFEVRGELGGWLFRRFGKWYAPRFLAWSQAEARSREFEADRAAADLGGARQLADALVRMRVVEETTVRDHWKAVRRQAGTSPEPPSSAITDLARALGQPPEDGEARRVLEIALRGVADLDETHPSLAARLAALGQEPRVPPPVVTSAAERYLGGLEAELLAKLDAAWSANAKAEWTSLHAECGLARKRLTRLDLESRARELTTGELLERANAILQLEGDAAARVEYESVLERDAMNATALLHVGQLRLAEEDESGLDMLRRAIQIDASLTITGCKAAADHLLRHGRPREAREFWQLSFARGEVEALAAKERFHLSKNPRKYGPHGLDSTAEEEMRGYLASNRRIQLAVLVERRLEHIPERRERVLLVRRRMRWFEFPSTCRTEEESLFAELQANVRSDVSLFVGLFDSSDDVIVRKLAKKVPGALVVRN